MGNDNRDSRNDSKGKVVKMRPRIEKPVKKKASAAPKPSKVKQAETKDVTQKASEIREMKKQVYETKNTMEKTMTKTTMAFDKFTKDAADMSREYSDACMKSSTIFMKGFESMMGAVMAMAQSSAEKQARFLKEAMSSKTINEFAEVQNKIAQSSFDDFMSGATKLSEMSVKVLTESSEPVNTQMTKAIQKATEAMAA